MDKELSKIKEVYEYADKIGVLIFSTIYNGEVHSRAAHLNGYDEDGIYFRTMDSKPYWQQLMDTKKVTICGINDNRVLGHLPDGTPIFPHSYTIRIIGEIEQVSPEIIIEKAKTNEMLKTASNDIGKYPTMVKGNFVITRAKYDIFELDENREPVLLRTRNSFGGMKFNVVGPTITDECIGCGKCLDSCKFKAIIIGEDKYIVDSRYCDDCGMCIYTCPINAIEKSKPI